LKKRTSINSISKLHKEKEMADFRKGLIAFAVVALLLVLGSSAYAQVNCIANSANPTTIRAEGVTELVGDVVMTCTGGTPQTAGSAILQDNITILLNTNVTSRLLSGTSATGGLSEAVIAVDEPFPGGTAVPTGQTPLALSAGGGTTTAATSVQLGCVANNSTNCSIISAGGGVGAFGPYSGAAGHPNLFQGTWNPALPQAISWTGVPIDAPGSATRVIRITNVRANACQLGVASNFGLPTQVFMLITITGSQNITISNPQPTVAAILPGLTVSSIRPGTFQQCVTLNNIIVNPSATTPVGVTANPTAVQAIEGFAAAFKPRDYQQYSGTVAAPVQSSTAIGLQNVLGFPYNSESGFVTGAASSAASTPAFGPDSNGFGAMGLADTGTELSFAFAGVSNGVTIQVPNQIFLYPVGATVTSTISGTTGLVTNTPSLAATGVAQLLGAAGGTATTTNLTISGGAVIATYEILLSNPSVQEFAYLPVVTAYASNTASNLPGTTTTPATIAVNFAPLSALTTAGSESQATIPRFCQTHTPVSLISINACTCNLLFPFVTNQAGYDTGVAIANTSSDPFKTAVQSGNVTLNYYGSTTGGGAAPAAQTTTSAIAGGSELVFTISSGGSNGVAATPGFQGYIIATAQFQYCHGFAFITYDLTQTNGVAEGYLALELDEPFWVNTRLGGISGFSNTVGSRTGQTGENDAH